MIPHNERTSVILRHIIEAKREGDNISLGDFVEMLGNRAFFLVILVFSLPNSIPVPGIPGFSTLTAMPIVFMTLQIMVGRNTIWLPERIAKKEFSHKMLASLLTKALPCVVWTERFLGPRWRFVMSPIGERFLAALMLVLALIIALPIPGGNFLPGLSMSLLALGMLERDGRFLAVAVTAALLGITVMYHLIMAFFTWFLGVLAGFF